MILVYQVKDKFVKIKINKKEGRLFIFALTKDIGKASYFTNKNDANSWETSIKYKHPEAELKEATLTLK